MSGLTEKLWHLISGIISLAAFIIMCLLVLGLIFSPDIRFNLTTAYDQLSSSGIVGIYVFILLAYTLFIGVMDALFALYNAGGINRSLITKIINGKIKSRFEIWMSRVIFIFFPIAIFLYFNFFIT